MEYKGIKVRTFYDGRAVFLAGIFDALNISNLIGQALSAGTGRRPEIPHGTMAKLMLINICDQHHPLYRLSEYYELKDLERLTHSNIHSEELEDHRFGHFLERLFTCNPREIFKKAALVAFVKYGLSIRTLNYDTTSKVMWGEYECDDGRLSAVYITFGHSKAHRPDKKQLKIGIGTADGAIADAKILDGNCDDKTYNNGVLDDVEKILLEHAVSKDTFYYIADAAFFTEENVRKAQARGLRFVTRVPETINLTKALIEKAWSKAIDFRTVLFSNAHNKALPYHIQDFAGEYRDVACTFTVCYSPTLELQKQKTIARHVVKEQEELARLAKSYGKRTFACEADALAEIRLFHEKRLPKVKYHTVELTTSCEEKRKRGRPKANQTETDKKYIFRVAMESTLNEVATAERAKRQATFVLATNNTEAKGEEILDEYKSQKTVEKKFQLAPGKAW